MANADPSLSMAERIDAACDRFEADWKAGKKPLIADFLSSAPESDRAELRAALLAVELELQGKSTAETSVTQSSVRSARKQPAPDETAAHLEPVQPTLIGRFEVRGTLGAGAFGCVYRAFDPHLGREVAVKVPRDAAVASDGDRALFLKEARAAATINHPNVCQIHEVGEADGRPYIVMAFVPGQSLADVLKARSVPLPEKQSALVVRKIALALAAAHAKGIVHRDLKPANVMFDRERNDIVVMDFGLARGPRVGDARATQSGVVMGTPAYMSPEQASGGSKDVGPAADVFSLGVILYELLTGARPFNGTATEVLGQILHVHPQPPSKVRDGVDPRLEAACLKAMAKDPAKRFASMKEFAVALDQIVRTPRPAPKATAKDAEATEVASSPSNIADVFAAISADRKKAQAETAAVVEAAIKKHKPPRWLPVLMSLIAIGGVAALARIVFYTQTDKVKVTIELTDLSLEDTLLSFTLDGTAITAAELAKPVELKPGEHILVVYRGREVVKQMRFTVVGGRSPGIRVKDITPGGAAERPRLELVRELQTPFNETSCWLSPDGLTIYFDRETVDPAPGMEERRLERSGVYKAKRHNMHSPFGPATFVYDARHAAFSSDERLVVALRPGPPPSVLLQGQRERDRADGPFGTLAVIEELRDQQNVKSPWLSRDGLTLVFQRAAAGRQPPASEFVICRRSSPTARWSTPERLPVPTDQFVTWPMLAEDGLTLFFAAGGTRFNSEVHVATRASAEEPFGSPRKVLFDGQPLLGRSPRYVAATRELFLSHAPGDKDTDLYVVKNFDPNRLAPALSDDRELATWFLRNNLYVGVTTGERPTTSKQMDGQWKWITRPEDLPKERFDLIGVGQTYKQLTREAIKRIGDAKNLCYLSLFGCAPVDDSALAVVSDCQELIWLNAEVTKVTDAGLKHLRGLKKLQRLELAHTAVTGVGLKDMPDAPLTWLSLGSAGSATPEAVQAISRYNRLEALWTRGNEAGDTEANTLFRSLSRLRGLVMNYQRMTDAGLADLPPLKELTELNLGDTRITGDGLRHLKGLSALTAVTLNNTPLKDDALAHLSELPRLTRLHLEGTPVGDAGLAHLKAARSLEQLNLKGTSTTDAGLAHVAQIRSLRLLLLDGTRITDEGIRCLADLKLLVLLSLVNTAVTDAGLEPLKSLPQLNSLDLAKTAVSDAGIKHLVVLRSLRGLNVPETRITPDGLRRLKAALPECHITPEPPTASAATDRQAAEWVLRAGGSVKVEADGVVKEVKAGGSLPSGPFTLRWVRFEWGNASVTDETMANLAGLSGLQELSLGGAGNLGDAGVAYLKGMSSLRLLGLDSTRVTDAAIDTLVTMPKLETLTTNGNLITDKGAANLATMKALRTLWLSGTQVTDAGLKHLARLPNLETLQLVNTPVSDASVPHLSAMKSLRQLELARTRVTPDGLRRLREALPASRITPEPPP